MVFVLLVGLVVIWAHELQSYAVPLVASVPETKELTSLLEGGAGLRVGWESLLGGRSHSDRMSSGIVLDHDISLRSSSSRSGRAQRRISIRAAWRVSLNACCLRMPRSREFRPGVWALYLVIPLRDRTTGEMPYGTQPDEVKAGCTLFMEESG